MAILAIQSRAFALSRSPVLAGRTSAISRKAFCGKALTAPAQVARRTGRVSAQASRPSNTPSGDETVDVDGIVKDLQDKWDRVENKTSVAVYAGGAVVALWLSTTIVGAVNAVPLLPKLLELVGLGYTSWFVYRYLLFKSSREELLEDVDELKKKISGKAQETTGQKPPSVK